ncbi:unnamed protein product [Calypogeia fissa]
MASMAALANTIAAAAPTACPSSSLVSRSSSSKAVVGLSTTTPLFAALKKQSNNGGARERSIRNARHYVVRATSSEDAGAPDGAKQVNDLIADLKTKWDGVENKSTVAAYAGGALVTLWFSSTIIGAVNSVPLLPKLLELVGLGYTGWFVYRYLLFKSSRKELVTDIEELKAKITGATSSITGSEE